MWNQRLASSNSNNIVSFHVEQHRIDLVAERSGVLDLNPQGSAKPGGSGNSKKVFHPVLSS